MNILAEIFNAFASIFTPKKRTLPPKPKGYAGGWDPDYSDKKHKKID